MIALDFIRYYALTDAECAALKDSDIFFGFPTWYKYLELSGDGAGGCSVQNFELGDIWLIAAAILDFLVRLAGLLAVFFVITGGFKYITSAGNPEKIASARRTIQNALAGLAVAIVATAVVSYVAQQLSGAGGGGIFVQTPADSSAIQRGLDVVHAVAAAAAVLMIVIGGLKYTSSTGDPAKVSSARNTILYALIGLVVVIFSAIITNFVVGNI